MFDFNSNFNNTFGELEVTEKFCENCNSSLSDVLTSSVVGCSNCYKTFKEEIKNYLLQKQGSFSHVGKIAIKRNSKLKIEEELSRLEQEKQQAVEDENFIYAENLKNQIEVLRGKI